MQSWNTNYFIAVPFILKYKKPFYPLKDFKIDHVSELILGPDNFLAIFEKYPCFEVLIKLLNLFWRGLNLSKLLLLFTKPFWNAHVTW